MFFPAGTFWKDWMSTRRGIIWFIWRGGAGAGGREREVQGSGGGGGWGSGRGSGRGRPRSTGGDGNLKQTPSYKTSLVASSPYMTWCSNMGVTSLIWVRMSDMEVREATWGWRGSWVGVVGGDVRGVGRV